MWNFICVPAHMQMMPTAYEEAIANISAVLAWGVICYTGGLKMDGNFTVSENQSIAHAWVCWVFTSAADFKHRCSGTYWTGWHVAQTALFFSSIQLLLGFSILYTVFNLPFCLATKISFGLAEFSGSSDTTLSIWNGVWCWVIFGIIFSLASFHNSVDLIW